MTVPPDADEFGMASRDAGEAVRLAMASARPPPPIADAPAQPAVDPPSVPVLQVDEFEGRAVAPRRWFVDGWVPDRNVTSLYGSGGTGKSLLAMQLATAGATGGDWLGMPVPRRKCLYLSCEDEADELHRRQVDINASMGVGFADFEGRYAWLARPGDDSVLLEYGKSGIVRPTKFGRQFLDICRDGGFQFIVIDTAADTFAGNEIIRTEVRQFISFLRRIALAVDGAVLLLAHPSVAGAKDHGYSGSTAWQGSVRSLLTFEHSDGDDGDSADHRILTRKKSNYAQSGNALSLRYVGGAFQTDTRPAEVSSPQQDFLDQDLFRNALLQLLERGLCPSASKQRENYAPKLIKRTLGRDFSQISVGRLERAMAGLFEAGQIKVQQHRKGTSPVTPSDYDMKLWRGG